MKNNLKATHEGKIKIGDTELSVAVLQDETRVITQSAVFKAFGRTKRGRKIGEVRVPNMPAFIDANNLQPFINEELRQTLNTISYTSKNGSDLEGYDANILPLMCKMYLDAREAIKLSPQQMPLARASEILLLALSKLGITALVDEATGYQDVRVKDALQKILDQYLLEDAKKYRVTFPLELYKQWFRLNNWDWREQNAQKRPSVIGKWTNKYIYERIAPNILKELEKKNPKNSKGHRKYKHFQFLTEEVGEPKLREFFGGLIALARATNSWKKYTELVERAYPKSGDQLDMFLDE
ncbi:hypothetical protein AAU57_11410 [Nonlabens sp. YIK11]|uniref:P63C domain-containing protein n=1 Tax=Nonlabens sp. YIK11 TaxID=1453349 RepID=UPI000707920E|nr:P63C domain-containing protein [Nonlabens sp. YIK11]KQC33869.1 hypothetical protein AAU57_11410 [Nonlabens sp. YIK11]